MLALDDGWMYGWMGWDRDTGDDKCIFEIGDVSILVLPFRSDGNRFDCIGVDGFDRLGFMSGKEKDTNLNNTKNRKNLFFPSESYTPSPSSFFPFDDRSLPLPPFFGFRFLVCMPSLRMASGRLTPCNLKYNPHALHTGSPSLFLRHNVVVLVPQFVQQRPNRLVAVYGWNGKGLWWVRFNMKRAMRLEHYYGVCVVYEMTVRICDKNRNLLVVFFGFIYWILVSTLFAWLKFTWRKWWNTQRCER